MLNDNATPTPTTTTVTAKTLTMASVKGHATMAAFFTRTPSASFDAAYVKGAAIEEYAATLAGCAVEVAYSGNSNGLLFLRNKIASLTLAKKHAASSVQSTVLARLENIKSAHLKSADIGVYVDFAESMQAELLAIMVTPKVDKPATVPTNWKARALAAEAMVQALQIDIAALTGKPVTVTAPAEAALV